MTRRSLVLIATVALTMTFALPAWSGFGGGTIVRVDHAPDEFVAGETYDIMYTVLRQGTTPIAGPSTIEVRSGNIELDFEGTPTGTVGQYVAEVALPEAGSWTWYVLHSRGATDMGVLEVEPFTLGRVLNHDVAALVIALVAAVVLALILSRGTRVSRVPGLRPTGTRNRPWRRVSHIPGFRPAGRAAPAMSRRFDG